MTTSQNARKSASDESLPGDPKSPTPQCESQKTLSETEALVPGTTAVVNGQSNDPPKIPILKGITTKLKEALAAGTKAELMVGILLDQGYAKVDQASFRVWVTCDVGMDEKQAYRLRAVGHVVRPLLENMDISLDYLLKVGISRLTTVIRFPEKLWQVETSSGRISVRADDKPEPVCIDEMTVAELRDRLKAIKGRDEQEFQQAKRYLGKIADTEVCIQLAGEELKPKREKYIPVVQEWQSRAKKEYERAEKLVQEKHAEIEKTKWLLKMLHGDYYDEIPGTAEAVTEALERNADEARRGAALAVAAAAGT